MASRKNLTEMVQGLGLGMAVLDKLGKAIVEAGGDLEILHYLTRNRSQRNLERIAQFIVECDWRIPASEMRLRTQQWYRREFEHNPEIQEEAENLWWSFVLQKMGIPVFKLHNDPVEVEPAIPPQITEELNGRRMEYPLFVKAMPSSFGREGENLVVVNIDMKSGYNTPKPGEQIVPSFIEALHLAEARHFDFEK